MLARAWRFKSSSGQDSRLRNVLSDLGPPEGGLLSRVSKLQHQERYSHKQALRRAGSGQSPGGRAGDSDGPGSEGRGGLLAESSRVEKAAQAMSPRVGFNVRRMPEEHAGGQALDNSSPLHILCGMEAAVKNITLALDEKIIRKGRKYATKHNLTLNSLVRKLLEKTVESDSSDWLEEAFRKMDKVKLPAGISKWKREDLYRA